MPPIRIDWFGLLRDLRYEAGMTHADIARTLAVPCCRRSISKLAEGVVSDPGHTRGEALRALYREKLNREPPTEDPRKGKKLPRQTLSIRPSTTEGGNGCEQIEPQGSSEDSGATG